MFDPVGQPPFLLIILCAGFWTFWWTIYSPGSIPRTFSDRLSWSMVEGFVCGTGCGALYVLLQVDLTADIILQGSLAGLTWAGTAFYSKGRYMQHELHTRRKHS
jgi:hypothetical protein